MSRAEPSPEPSPRAASRVQLRVWHLALLVLFVAVAIVNIQDQRREEPVLIALASGGFVLYGLLGRLVWRFGRRFESRLGPATWLALYLVVMAALFLTATVAYLLMEYGYTTGWFR
jgi:chromate transport protein ChrA